MLEILFVIFLWRKLGDMLEEKGYLSTIWMKLFLVFAWIFGEITGAVVMLLVSSGSDPDVMTWVGALIGAFIGAGVVFGIAAAMPVRTRELEPIVKDRPVVLNQRIAPPEESIPKFEPPVPGQQNPPTGQA